MDAREWHCGDFARASNQRSRGIHAQGWLRSPDVRAFSRSVRCFILEMLR